MGVKGRGVASRAYYFLELHDRAHGAEEKLSGEEKMPRSNCAKTEGVSEREEEETQE